MKNEAKEALNIFFGVVMLAILAGLLVAVLYLLKWIVLGVLSLDKEVAAAFIGGFVTVGVAVLTLVITARSNKKKDIAEAHRPEKMRVYSDFMGFYFDAFKKSRLGESINPEAALSPEAIERGFEITKGMIGWASPSVIKTALRLGSAGPENPEQGLLQLNEVLLAMRKDLGLTNRGLQPGDLIQMFLTPEARKEWEMNRHGKNQDKGKRGGEGQ